MGEADLSAYVDFGALKLAAERSGAPVRCHGPVDQRDLLWALGIEQRLEALLERASGEQAEALVRGYMRLLGDGPVGGDGDSGKRGGGGGQSVEGMGVRCGFVPLPLRPARHPSHTDLKPTRAGGAEAPLPLRVCASNRVPIETGKGLKRHASVRCRLISCLLRRSLVVLRCRRAHDLVSGALPPPSLVLYFPPYTAGIRPLHSSMRASHHPWASQHRCPLRPLSVDLLSRHRRQARRREGEEEEEGGEGMRKEVVAAHRAREQGRGRMRGQQGRGMQQGMLDNKGRGGRVRGMREKAPLARLLKRAGDDNYHQRHHWGPAAAAGTDC